MAPTTKSPSAKKKDAFKALDIDLDELVAISFHRSSKDRGVWVKGRNYRELIGALSRATPTRASNVAGYRWVEFFLGGDDETWNVRLKMGRECIGPDVANSKAAIRWFYQETDRAVVARLIARLEGGGS